MNYLFLDIDGVLNTGQYSNYLVDNGLCETDADGYLFDPEAVKNLRYIIEKTDAKIIITSTWRLDGDMQALWYNRKLAGEVVGVTPTIQKEPGGLVPVSHKVSFHVMSPAKSKSL